MIIENKLKVLSKIAKELNKNNIIWGVGGSLLLYFKGITKEFNDSDIVVSEENVEKAKEILLSFGKLEAPNPNLQYKTKYFLEFKVENVDIDIMAGFTIVSKDKEYYFPLKKENIKDYTKINDILIPLQSVEEWRNYYGLMGRTEKVQMIERTVLNKELDAERFRNFYYLKEELVDFCRRNGLPTSGGKIEITERIAHFLDTGEVLKVISKSKVKKDIGVIIEDSIIEDNFICSEKHRIFFKDKIGKSFSFNVAFQKWLKSNSGNTYEEAIQAYYDILEEKKKGKTIIDKQFEYNTYIRDFFAYNEGKTLDEAIKCWKYKKSLQGHNRYEKTDLVVL